MRLNLCFNEGRSGLFFDGGCMLVRYVFAVVVAAGLAFAQAGEEMGGGAGGGGGRGGGGRGGGGMDSMGGGGMPRMQRQSKLEMLADKLKLKNDQKSEV